MAYENIQRVLSEYGEVLASIYKQHLADENVDSSFTLANSIQTRAIIGDNVYFVEIQLEDYWYYIEEGRSPGSFPPVQAILNWITQKPIIPESYTLPNGNQRIPTNNQLAFLIGRKIANEGIEGKHLLALSNEEVFDLFYDRLYEALALDISNDLTTVITTITN